MIQFNNQSLYGPTGNKPVKGKVVYRNLTGDSLDSLKQQVTDLTAQIQSISKRIPILQGFVSWAQGAINSKQIYVALGKPWDKLSEGELDSGAKAYLKDSGFALGIPVAAFPTEIPKLVSTWQDKLSQAQKDLDSASKLYNDALLVAGQTDPETIKAVSDAKVAADQVASSSQLKKWLTIGGIAIVGIGLLFGLYVVISNRKKAAPAAPVAAAA